jgi:hypothetical protein
MDEKSSFDEYLERLCEALGCCRRLCFDPDAEILVNRAIVDLMVECEAFTSSPPGSSTRRQPVEFGVGSNSCGEPSGVHSCSTGN